MYMPQKLKKIPERKCMGCNEKKPKRELIRVVRTPEGQICLDEKGKMSGRGVYICPDAKCLEKARKAKRLERSLETAIPDEVYDDLSEKISSIKTESEVEQ